MTYKCGSAQCLKLFSDITSSVTKTNIGERSWKGAGRRREQGKSVSQILHSETDISKEAVSSSCFPCCASTPLYTKKSITFLCVHFEPSHPCTALSTDLTQLFMLAAKKVNSINNVYRNIGNSIFYDNDNHIK